MTLFGLFFELPFELSGLETFELIMRSFIAWNSLSVLFRTVMSRNGDIYLYDDDDNCSGDYVEECPNYGPVSLMFIQETK